LLALFIRRDGGPAFYTQKRVGRNGREFDFLKLRTRRGGRAGPVARARTAGRTERAARRTGRAAPPGVERITDRSHRD
ncbi:MAG: sugar transferase, partial [Pseudomonadota bacterium]